MKRLLTVLCILVVGILLANSAFAERGHRGGHNEYRGRSHHSSHHGSRVANTIIGVAGGLLLYDVVDRIIDPPPRVIYVTPSQPAYRCTPPCSPYSDAYNRAYQEERERIRRQEIYRQQQEGYRDGRDAAHEGYYEQR
ncbi:MAG: hypothetical protein WAV31_03210 [Candidatus Moraniibacteriota bacterium]